MFPTDLVNGCRDSSHLQPTVYLVDHFENTCSLPQIFLFNKRFDVLRYLMVGLAVVLILHEEVLVGAVSGEENGSRAEARQRALEAVEACEGALETPGITSKDKTLVFPTSNGPPWSGLWIQNVRSLPGVVARSTSSLLELTHVEAGNAGLAAGGS